MQFGQLLVTGIAIGFVYGLVAMGFVLIYKGSGVFNFAQSGLVLIGAWILWTVMDWLKLPLGVALLLTLVLSALGGYLIQRIFLKPLAGQPLLTLVMATLALMALLDGLTVSLWGGPVRAYAFTLPGPQFVTLGPIQIGMDYIWIIGACVVALAIFFVFFKYAKLGLAMRATGDDPRVAQTCGISLSRMFSWAWILSAILAAMAGIFLGYRMGLQAQISSMGVKALPIALLGGLESLSGAVIGGLLIGVVEALAGVYLDPLVGGGLKDIFPFIIMIIILFIRPQGLFGYQIIERV